MFKIYNQAALNETTYKMKYSPIFTFDIKAVNECSAFPRSMFFAKLNPGNSLVVSPSRKQVINYFSRLTARSVRSN